VWMNIQQWRRASAIAFWSALVFCRQTFWEDECDTAVGLIRSSPFTLFPLRKPTVNRPGSICYGRAHRNGIQDQESKGVDVMKVQGK
jgi:hypothetical protein